MKNSSLITDLISQELWGQLEKSLNENTSKDETLVFAVVAEMKKKCDQACVHMDNVRRIRHIISEPTVESLMEIVTWDCDSDAGEDFKLKIIDHFLSLGMSPNVKSGYYSSTPLHYAAASEDLLIMSRLIAAGADIDGKDDKGWTPLHWAANNNLAACQFLVEAGANMGSQNDEGLTPEDMQTLLQSDESEAIRDYLHTMRLIKAEQSALHDITKAIASETQKEGTGRPPKKQKKAARIRL